MDFVWGTLLAALIGWLHSLIARTLTSNGILLDILVSALGGLALSLMLGNRGTVDNLAAGVLGGSVAAALLFAGRRLNRRHSM